MIVCWLLKTSPVNMLFYLGYLVPKVPSTTYYTESWKVAPYYQRIEGICSKVVVLFLSIPRNSPGVEGGCCLAQLLTFIQTGLCVLQPSQNDSHYSPLKNLQRLIHMESL